MHKGPAIALALSILATVGVEAAEPELKGTPAELRQFLRTGNREIVLVGHAKQTVQADVGHVSVVVHTQGKDLTSAIAANAQRRETLAQSLQSQGIDAKKIRAQKFSSSPQYGWFGKTPSSFEATNRLIVDVADERELMIVTAAAANPPDLTIGVIAFEYSKQRDLEEQVRREAFDDALAKKGFYEQRLGATLRPVGFRFSDASARGTEGGELDEVVVTGSRSVMGIAQSHADSYAPLPSFDEKLYEVSAVVTFAVEPLTTAH
jgi:uncharacterized protein YggE